MMDLFRRLAGAFLRDQSGGIAALIGFMIVPLIGFVGLAVDSSRIYITQSRIQFALDSAGLAAAKAYQETTGDVATRQNAARTAATAYFNANMDLDTNAASRQAHLVERNGDVLRVLDNGKRFQVAASITIPTTFMRVLAVMPMGQQLGPVQNVTINVSTEVTRSTNKQEIVLALDNTGSMYESSSGQVRFERMRAAVKEMVNLVFDGSEAGYVRIAIVPYATSVNIRNEIPLSDNPSITANLGAANARLTDAGRTVSLSTRRPQMLDRCPGSAAYCARPTSSTYSTGYASDAALTADFLPGTSNWAWRGCVEDSPADPSITSSSCSTTCTGTLPVTSCTTTCAMANSVNDTYSNMRFFPFQYASTIGVTTNYTFTGTQGSQNCITTTYTAIGVNSSTPPRNDFVPAQSDSWRCTSGGSRQQQTPCISDAFEGAPISTINLNTGYNNWAGGNSGSQRYCQVFSSNVKVGNGNSASANYSYTVGPNTNCPVPMLALSGNAAQIKRALDHMQAGNGGGTHNDYGARWALRMLSPNWSSFFGMTTAAAAFNDPNVDKVAILLTDGDNNRTPYGGHGYQPYNGRTINDGRAGSGTDSALDALQLRACEALKASAYNVQVYGFTVDLGSSSDETFQKRLTCACSSGTTVEEKNKYCANVTGSELQDRFRQLAADLRTLRLSN
ncbi:pilus assembly protein TadG-related protein [Zavarzinia sp. CC-PAN008]|uniref:vWA domain-containing protein n=1 Tax=Zavarzinia sp. CC-PAN008 TaxID=3243332 RepID=UPI003F749F91